MWKRTCFWGIINSHLKSKLIRNILSLFSLYRFSLACIRKESKETTLVQFHQLLYTIIRISVINEWIKDPGNEYGYVNARYRSQKWTFLCFPISGQTRFPIWMLRGFVLQSEANIVSFCRYLLCNGRYYMNQHRVEWKVWLNVKNLSCFVEIYNFA